MIDLSNHATPGAADADLAANLLLTIRHIEVITPSIAQLHLAAAGRSVLKPFAPGAHIKVRVSLPDGREERRSYSLINSDNQSDEYVIAVQREPEGRGGSLFMHKLRVGDVVTSSAPCNEFPLAIDAERHILVAGGIGITPLLSMAFALRAAGKPFELHYVARTPESMAFRDKLEAMPSGQCFLYFDEGNPALGLRIGDVIGSHKPGFHVYVCGPRGMIDAVIRETDANGWPISHVHYESFGPDVRPDDGTVEIVLQRSGLTIGVPPTQTILDTLLAAGIDHPHDCRRGECSACQVDVLQGIPDNRDFCLSGPDYDAGKIMCVCVSRSRTPKLVLDL